MKISRFPNQPIVPKKFVGPVGQNRPNRDQLGIRHDDVNDVMMTAGAVALFGGMFLRSLDPCLGNFVAASAGLFIGAALLR